MKLEAVNKIGRRACDWDGAKFPSERHLDIQTQLVPLMNGLLHHPDIGKSNTFSITCWNMLPAFHHGNYDNSVIASSVIFVVVDKNYYYISDIHIKLTYVHIYTHISVVFTSCLYYYMCLFLFLHLNLSLHTCLV